MNHLIESFNQLYPAYKTTRFTGSCSIDETEQQTGKTLQNLLITGADGEQFPRNLPKDASSFYKKANARSELRLDCDGIIFTEHKGKKYIIVCELKSSFSETAIVKAKDQLVGSYLKLHALFSLLQDYRNEEVEVRGVIASFLPETERLSVLKNPEDPKTRFCFRLQKEGKYLMPHDKCKEYYSPLWVPDFTIHYVGVPDKQATHSIKLDDILL